MKRNLIDLPTVIAISSLSRPTIYRHMDKGIFPRQIQCQDGRVRWYLVDVIQWCIKKHPELFGSDVADAHPRRKMKRLRYAGTGYHYEFGAIQVAVRRVVARENDFGDDFRRRRQPEDSPRVPQATGGTDFGDDFRSELRPRHLRKIGEVPEDSPRVRRRMPE